MKCTKCGADNLAENKFCSECGNSMPINDTVDEVSANQNPASNSTNSNKAPIGKILLWIFFLPIMLIITIVQHKKFNKATKAILISLVVIFSFAVAVNGAEGEDGPVNGDSAKQTEKVEEKEVPKVSDDEKQINNISKKSEISKEAAKNLLESLKLLEVKYSDVSNWAPINNWENGQRSAFEYKDLIFNVYFNQDGSINSINSGDVKFLQANNVLIKIEDKIISSENKIALMDVSKQYVTKVLKAPSTAEFPGGGIFSMFEDWQFSRDKNIFIVKSYVDAQNGFGAMIRSEFTMRYNWDGKSNQPTLESFIFAGEKVL